MRRFFLLVLLFALAPSFVSAYLVKDKEAAELAYRLRDSQEVKDLGERVEKAYKQERLNELANHRPKVNLTDEDRARLELEYKLAQEPPTYIENKRGFLPVENEIEYRNLLRMADLKDAPKYRPSKFFKVELNNGEVSRVSIEAKGNSIFIIIPRNANEYVMEVECWVDGKKTAEDAGLSEKVSQIDLPARGKIILKYTRASALLK
ncbi:MAG: hypothetical protein AAB965_03900 [Patescibacteria group bacterium]